MDLIINYTPTGMIPSKQMTPHVPTTIEEIIQDVKAAYMLGITIAHLHARDEQGQPTTSTEIYSKIIKGIKEFAPELVICVSLSGRLHGQIEERIKPLQQPPELKPDMGSLTLSSLNFTQQASTNSPQTILALANEMKQHNIQPEFEIFDVGMANYMKYIIKKLNLLPPYYTNILVGNIASAQLDLNHIGSILHDLPDHCKWALAGIGTTQYPANMIALALGGGIRIGLEDNIYYDQEKKKLATNLELLTRIHQLARLSDRKVMEPHIFRAIFGMRQ